MSSHIKLAALLCLCPFAAVLAGDVIFNDLGTVAAPVSYGHLTFALTEDELTVKYADRAWTILQHFVSNNPFGDGPIGCDDILDRDKERHDHHCSLFELVTNANSTAQKVFLAEMREIAAQTRIISQEMTSMIFGKRGPRAKRQAGLVLLGALEVISFGLTLKNAYDISVFKERMNGLKSQVDGLIQLNDEIVRTQLRDHKIIEKLLNTTAEMRKEVTSERITARYLLYKMVGTGIQEEARQMYASLALLHQGIVSTNLVNYTQLDSSYNEFKRMAGARGMRPVFDSADVLLGEHAAYWIENGNTLRFAIPVPIIPIEAKLLTAYRLESDPTSVPGEDNLQLEFVSPHQYILVNHDRSYYYALTADEWSRCIGPDGRKICPEVRMRRDIFQNSCIGALFKGLTERKSLCGVKVRRAPSLEVKEVRVGLLRVLATSDTPIQWRTHCSAGSRSNVTLTRNGTTYMNVPEGCTVYGPSGAYFNPPNTIRVDTKLETVDQHDLELPPSLAAFDDWTDVRGVLDEQDIKEYVDATKLSEMRERRILKHLHTITGGGGSGYAIALVVVVAVVFLLAVGSAVFTYLMWRRISNVNKVSLLETAIGESSHPPLSPRPSLSQLEPTQQSPQPQLPSLQSQLEKEMEAPARTVKQRPPQLQRQTQSSETDTPEPKHGGGGRRRKKASWPPQADEVELVNLSQQQ